MCVLQSEGHSLVPLPTLLTHNFCSDLNSPLEGTWSRSPSASALSLAAQGGPRPLVRPGYRVMHFICFLSQERKRFGAWNF